MLVYRQQKSWFVMVNQHGHHTIVIGIPWDSLHTLYLRLSRYFESLPSMYGDHLTLLFPAETFL